MRPLFILVALLLLAAGCLAVPAPEEPSYAVDGDGRLTLATPPPDMTGSVLEERGNVTVSSIVFRNGDTDVHALLAEPARPVMGIVYAPGAGVPAEAHRERAIRYAESGIAFLVVDIRGNGGDTPGEPLDIEQDYRRFAAGEWPQVLSDRQRPISGTADSSPTGQEFPSSRWALQTGDATPPSPQQSIPPLQGISGSRPPGSGLPETGIRATPVGSC